MALIATLTLGQRWELVRNITLDEWKKLMELRGGFSASDIRKTTVTLGDPDVFNIRSDLASFLGHSEATQDRFYHQRPGSKDVAAADTLFRTYTSEVEERVVNLGGVGDDDDETDSGTEDEGTAPLHWPHLHRRRRTRTLQSKAFRS